MAQKLAEPDPIVETAKALGFTTEPEGNGKKEETKP
jgi:hypothetical protein